MDPLSLEPDPAANAQPPGFSPWTPPPPTPRRGRLGWFGHLFFLTAWLLSLIVGWELHRASGRPHVAVGSVEGVLRRVALESLIFGAVCALAWGCSRATLDEWRVRWRGGFGPIWRGVLYSFALRIVVMVITIIVVVTLVALRVIDPNNAKALRPQVENAVSPSALAHDRAFFWCAVTLLSACAGIVEEIWRGGMLAGLAGTFPKMFGGRIGQWAAVVPVAVFFGLGHLYMGWPAVAAAALLGLGLGAIMVWHRTIWDAVIAHALFDAGSLAASAWLYQNYPHTFGR